jgi:RNA polymerase sigma factor (sigma-70 family)
MNAPPDDPRGHAGGTSGRRPTDEPSAEEKAYAEHTLEKQQERAARLAEDANLIAHLALEGFIGPGYEKFQLELIKYGTAILKTWMRSGEIFARCRKKNLRLREPPRPMSDQDREDIITFTLAKGLKYFREKALLGGSWDPSRGANITTYFVNGLLMPFANSYREWCDRVCDEMADIGELTPEGEMYFMAADTAMDPQQIIVQREAIREGLNDLPGNTNRILVLKDYGYKHAEVAEALDITERAVERTLARHRERLKRQHENPTLKEDGSND